MIRRSLITLALCAAAAAPALAQPPMDDDAPARPRMRQTPPPAPSDRADMDRGPGRDLPPEAREQIRERRQERARAHGPRGQGQMRGQAGPGRAHAGRGHAGRGHGGPGHMDGRRGEMRRHRGGFGGPGHGFAGQSGPGMHQRPHGDVRMPRFGGEFRGEAGGQKEDKGGACPMCGNGKGDQMRRPGGGMHGGPGMHGMNRGPGMQGPGMQRGPRMGGEFRRQGPGFGQGGPRGEQQEPRRPMRPQFRAE